MNIGISQRRLLPGAIGGWSATSGTVYSGFFVFFFFCFFFCAWAPSSTGVWGPSGLRILKDALGLITMERRDAATNDIEFWVPRREIPNEKSKDSKGTGALGRRDLPFMGFLPLLLDARMGPMGPWEYSSHVPTSN